MSRLVAYRTKVSEEVAARIDQTLATTMYLVQTTGPTSYVIQEQNSEKKHKVLIGSLQTCSCGEADICIHILFVMLKILRVPAGTPIVWQKSLIDSEIETLLRGGYREQSRPAIKPFVRKRKEAAVVPETEDANVDRHGLVEGEVCAICQEDMEDNQPLTFCRKGCGNNFHIECMKVFGESRRQSKENIICPLCRHDWGDLALSVLRKEIDAANRAPNVHKGSTCRKCRMKPIRSERYRCVTCKSTDLCARCFKANTHANHPFVMKKNVHDSWVPALRDNHRRAAISTDLMTELENRELSTNDYDVLLQLDHGDKYAIQDYLVTVLPGTKIDAQDAKTFGEPGASCSLCCQSLRIQTDLHSIQCGHIFHESCLSRSILSQVYTCPFPGCDFVLFPGLLHLQRKQELSKSGHTNEVKELRDAMPPLDPSFSVLGLQQRSASTQESECTRTKGNAQLKAATSSRLAKRRDMQQRQPGGDGLPPLLGLHSVGLVPHARQTMRLSLPAMSERGSTTPAQNQFELESVNSGESRAKSAQHSVAGARGKLIKKATRKVGILPHLDQPSRPSLFSADSSVTEARLNQAEQIRAELNNLGKQRLQTQRLQREERTRRHKESNNTPDFGGGFHAAVVEQDRMVMAQVNRTTAQQRAQQDRESKRKLKEQQRHGRQSNQPHTTLPDLFIGGIK